MSLEASYKTIRKVGFNFTLGAMSCFGMFYLLGLLLSLSLTSIDDCDKGFFDRCGMKVVTDHKTGKQYLLSPYGGIIERMQITKEQDNVQRD